MYKSVLLRTISIFLVFVMVLSFVACSNDSDYYDDDDENDISSTSKNTSHVPSDNSSEDVSDETSDDDESYAKMVHATKFSDPDLRYVMIYNPKIYDERKLTDKSTLTLGTLGSQVDAYTNRGDGLEDETQYTSISQLEWLQYFPEELNLEDDRADPMGVDYELGQEEEFYYMRDAYGNSSKRDKATFTCQYVGEYCYVWAMNDDNVKSSAIKAMGKEFDKNIYETVTDTFGNPRFVGETGKVNLLLFDMYGGLLGYFTGVDIFTESELAGSDLKNATSNNGPFININAKLLENSSDRELVYSTTAHEFQHLINFSACFETKKGVAMNVWLNEGMSGYIETVLYSNSKELNGHYDVFNESDLIRNGQSLYNFGTENGDIGVYGSVYYFSKYLENLAGKSIFTDIMDYWRDSYSGTLSTSEALAESVSKKVYSKINNSIDYSPLDINFKSDSDEWMSKLTLNFYLSTLSNGDDISEFENIKPKDLLYDSIDGADIEGGGRLIVALSDDTFEIPEDSDDGLIYVGLDKNFKPITDFIYQ